MGIGAQLVRTPAVKAAIARNFTKWDLKGQDVIDELHRIGFADLRDVAEWDGERLVARPSDEITDDAAAAVAEVSLTSTEAAPHVKVKLHGYRVVRVRAAAWRFALTRTSSGRRASQTPFSGQPHNVHRPSALSTARRFRNTSRP